MTRKYLKRMIPSGLKECHGCRLISTIKSVVSDLRERNEVSLGGRDHLNSSPFCRRNGLRDARKPGQKQSKHLILFFVNAHLSLNPGCFFDRFLYAFWYLPACRIIQAGGRSTGIPSAALTRRGMTSAPSAVRVEYSSAAVRFVPADALRQHRGFPDEWGTLGRAALARSFLTCPILPRGQLQASIPP